MSETISQQTNHEEAVFEVVKQYLNENRIMETNNLVNYIKSYFTRNSINISEEGIKKSLELLIKKKRIVEGSKLTNDSILLNKKRNRIYQTILSNPGIIFIKIVKKTSLSNHVVFWHVGMLLKFNKIRKIQVNSREIYFDAKVSEEKATKSYFKSKRECKNILDFLEIHREGANKATIAAETKMHPKTIKKYLSFLIDHNFVEKQKFSPREVLFFLKHD